MSSSPKRTFDYTTLNETVLTQLKAALATIRRNSRSTVKSTMAIGMALLDVKRHLEHGQFKAWVIEQCGFSIRTAERYMRVAEFLEYDTVSHLQLSTIYRLSAKNISASIVAQILATQTSEGPLSDNQVDALLDQLRQGDAPAIQHSSAGLSPSHLMGAWLAASDADRNELVLSLRADLVSSAWQAMNAAERASFVIQRSVELTALLNARSDEPVNDTDAEAANVVQLFVNAPSIVEDSNTAIATSSIELSHH
ncbi:DUF3102 domain-containing protein [Bradyrhizobium sp. CB3481]|uniref:DUF3102 domain-containing protein n=1 Tax=Bradyrhizobium sp. CB3481 TaxID=3039158 RepID=UPI0024B0BEB0|nr:DUF3102 domain-containing protein [Bradyrhizobium sp. CB3481]WFU16432.1 DUF3102 domain-containing protein [Bradyrhizobium sp. CB3481]